MQLEGGKIQVSRVMRLLVLIPTYNERENIENLIRELFALDLSLEVLVVDDLSPDGTGKIVEGLKGEYGDRLNILHRQGPRGRGYAGIEAFQWAANKPDVDWVVEMDADGSHAPRYLSDLIRGGQNADVVLGSRYVEGGGIEGWSILRHLNSRVAGWVAKLLLGLSVKDPTSGYRLFRHEVIRQLPWDRMISNNPSIVEEILYHVMLQGFRIVEVPILFVDRQQGHSKLSPWLISRWISNLWKVRQMAHDQ